VHRSKIQQDLGGFARNTRLRLVKALVENVVVLLLVEALGFGATTPRKLRSLMRIGSEKRDLWHVTVQLRHL